MYQFFCKLIGNFYEQNIIEIRYLYLANLIKLLIRILLFNRKIISCHRQVIIIVSGLSSKSDIYSVFYTPIFLLSYVQVC